MEANLERQLILTRYWWKWEGGSVKWTMYYTLSENLTDANLTWKSGYLVGHHSWLEDRNLAWIDERVFSSQKPVLVLARTHTSGEKIHYGCPKQQKEMRLWALPHSIWKERKSVHVFNNVHVCSFFCTWHWRPLSTALKEVLIHCTGRVF